MVEYTYELKIPKVRVAVLIGTQGNVKKELEELTHSRFRINSEEGEVSITGEDSLGLFVAQEIIRAIARGFNPEIAKLLLKNDYQLELLNIPDYAGKSKNKLLRLKGRVIGADGKTRKLVEELTETHITIFGKTIAIIGMAANGFIAKRAMESLLSGSPHVTVYKWLERKRRELKQRALTETDEIKEEYKKFKE